MKELCLIKEKRKQVTLIQTLTWNTEYKAYVPTFKLKIGKEIMTMPDSLTAYGLGFRVFARDT